jgi:hypothetical protein
MEIRLALKELEDDHDIDVKCAAFSFETLQQLLASFRPHVVHLWTHGSDGGTLDVTLSERDDACASVVDTPSLAGIISESEIELLILGVCSQAESNNRSLVAQLRKAMIGKRNLIPVLFFDRPVSSNLVAEFHIGVYTQLFLDYEIERAHDLSKRLLIARADSSVVEQNTIEGARVAGDVKRKILVARRGTSICRIWIVVVILFLIAATIAGIVIYAKVTQDCENGVLITHVPGLAVPVWHESAFLDDHRGLAEALCLKHPCELHVTIPPHALRYDYNIFPTNLADKVEIWDATQFACVLSMKVAYWGPPFTLFVGFDAAEAVKLDLSCPTIGNITGKLVKARICTGIN